MNYIVDNCQMPVGLSWEIKAKVATGLVLCGVTALVAYVALPYFAAVTSATDAAIGAALFSAGFIIASYGVYALMTLLFQRRQAGYNLLARL